MSHRIALILMAAGDSTRFCASTNISLKKQWLRVGDKPLWQKVAEDLSALYPFCQIIIAASASDFLYMQCVSPFPVVKGGDTRAQSLRNALECVDAEFVFVSDVARWYVDRAVCERLFACLENPDFACAVPFVSVPDTTFYQGEYLVREDIKRIQTPQLSHTQTLRKALDLGDFSDESSAIHALGKRIDFVLGSVRLSKLTLGEDLRGIGLLPPSKESFCASGFDVHAFEEGKPMVLGGVSIESPLGFRAHSDGDVLLHALSDAILGAMCAGDIGQWFPDTSEEFRGADSKKLLAYIYTYAKSVGFEVRYVDITIMAQIPKIAPYKQQIRDCVATLLALPKSRVSIKATTTESLGFIGRKEGVAVSANVTLGYIQWDSILN
ncbi:bifunctional 2-C-methyl-D-erythritol 4-phosphate cytidylyltransferase/2-C-methyl-D-erythritol 2,4-cyclodiphosphate synthase [uncultured Helicobacter sp.]|uniref:bifunctional 2-C-methyl-D-erythritol 4-phosphate cytidylyltransferase/2-C-methyl-D-erythritol 2,4-cyclodiphosphate synthase n=1 Tax=uncultured Helicobacter sp. TaxID=175537 RepID=UPI001C3A0F61|nr:bifunctional 2-C-methyl-D-erythritol 4-phosphate cytidylyltransferase/2-C-methyl-D-erythritol 2,4-cyclodiphosphate synthase [Candidatus Helicobacter avicola]